MPPLKGRVNDLTGTLSAQQQQALEQTLAEFEGRKGAQIAVLLVPTTKPEPVQMFAVRVQESWKLGRKGVDDGVLLAIAKDDRELHIEVGYGLEGALPDAIAKRIIEEEIVPRFRQGDFYGGIRAGTDRIMRVIEGEPLPAPKRGPAVQAPEGWSGLMPLLFFVIFLGGFLRLLFGRFFGGVVAGGVAGVAGWLLMGSLIVAIMFAVFAFFVILASGGAGRGARYGGYGGGWSSR
ncbi:MAG TPA: YgcG family protein, partial [Burkholderiales bacterium]|nr:YgcG family protein [Burkholderiales bacterium]